VSFVVHNNFNVLKIKDLRTEYQTNPVGVGTYTPRLSWKIDGDGRNVLQTAFRIKCAESPERLKNEKQLLWDSGKIHSDQSIHIPYKGNRLISGQRIFWQVKAWDNRGREAEWSEPAFWETGLLEKADWKARWIEPDIRENPAASNPCPYLRKEFRTEKPIKKATIYVTCHGLYHLQLNGKTVGNEMLTPGWTSYHKRLQYQTYDVAEQITAGRNALGVILGDGWYRGFFGWEGKKNLYGVKTALLFQLTLVFEDGSEKIIVSDKSWKASTGPILESEIYHGEIYDSRLEKKGWNKPGFDDSFWQSVSEKEYPPDNLVSTDGPPVRITKEIHPVQKISTPKKERVFDFGQNFVGWVQLTLKGKRGDKITIRHAEVLDKEGNFYTRNLRTAKQRVAYWFNGEGTEIYEPHFTFMGFRYIRIDDFPGEVEIRNFCGKVLHSDLEFTGSFHCSDSLVNQLQSNIQWSLRGNFVDVPTDCPQRDERMGWTGDAQIFAPTACFNVNAASFFSKWLRDLAADQRSDGRVPWVVPMVLENGGSTGWSDGYGASGWADAAITLPWELYMRFGDQRILEVQYPSMKAWEEYMIREAGKSCLFRSGFHFGDWLSFAEYSSYLYNAPDYGYAGAHTAKDLIATAYFYYSTRLMQKTAALLGHLNDEQRYRALLPAIKEAFRKEFITPNGRLVSGTQTAYAMALHFGLIPEDLFETAARRLANDVHHFQHITTGFLGTPLICDALTDAGFPELAYQLLLNTRYPSWLYPITMGATTIWERWDGIRPDGSFQDAGMNSFNHYAYGAIGNWLYTKVAGIQTCPDNPGYKKFLVKPEITDKLTWVKTAYQSPYGEIQSSWERKEKKLTMEITVPANTKAILYIPSANKTEITESGETLENTEGLKIMESNDRFIVVEAGSGRYVFESPLKFN
jgi:alpha-L-rhamnosidase